jgi:hypothetical protein
MGRLTPNLLQGLTLHPIAHDDSQGSLSLPADDLGPYMTRWCPHQQAQAHGRHHPMKRYPLIVLFVLITTIGVAACSSTSPTTALAHSHHSSTTSTALTVQPGLPKSTLPSTLPLVHPTIPVSTTTSPSSAPLPTLATPSPPSSTTTTTAPVGTTADGYDHRWDAVARCEEGGWGHNGVGGGYIGDLGISRAAWASYGGGSDLSPAAQVAVAQRIEGTSFVPDQGGCAAW